MTLRARLHELLQASEEGDRASRVTDVVVMLVIFVDLSSFVLLSVPEVAAEWSGVLHDIERGCLFVFVAEYALRMWACTADERWRAPLRGRLAYARTPLALIDLLAILPVIAYLPSALAVFALPGEFTSVRAFRFVRVLRLLRLSRYSNPLRILGRSLWRMRRELGTIILLESIVLLIASSLAYRIEQSAEPDTFRSIPDAMWWVLVTMTTVGYGDVVPVTHLGRVLGVLVMVCGVALFAIPTGMLGASFVEEMNEERERARKLREKRRRKVAELKVERGEHDVLTCPHCAESFSIDEPRH